MTPTQKQPKKCKYCWDKGSYSVWKGTSAPPDFYGDKDHSVAPEWCVIPCPKCSVPHPMTPTPDMPQKWKCSDCKQIFTDEEADKQEDNRCPKCFMPFEQMPYNAPHGIAEKILVPTPPEIPDSSKDEKCCEKEFGDQYWHAKNCKLMCGCSCRGRFAYDSDDCDCIEAHGHHSFYLSTSSETPNSSKLEEEKYIAALFGDTITANQLVILKEFMNRIKRAQDLLSYERGREDGRKESAEIISKSRARLHAEEENIELQQAILNPEAQQSLSDNK